MTDELKDEFEQFWKLYEHEPLRGMKGVVVDRRRLNNKYRKEHNIIQHMPRSAWYVHRQVSRRIDHHRWSPTSGPSERF